MFQHRKYINSQLNVIMSFLYNQDKAIEDDSQYQQGFDY